MYCCRLAEPGEAFYHCPVVMFAWLLLRFLLLLALFSTCDESALSGRLGVATPIKNSDFM